MKPIKSVAFYFLFFLLATMPQTSSAHHPDYKDHDGSTHLHKKKEIRPKIAKTEALALADDSPATKEAKSTLGVSGQGKMRFKVLYTRDHLPKEAVEVLERAHGGFGVDRRSGKGEIYFALLGAGIIQISSDLKTTRIIDTPSEMRDLNMHNATVWHEPNGKAYISFPANTASKVFITTLDGKLVYTQEAPTADDDFEHPTVNDYFRKGGKFVPTDVEEIDGLLYMTTGYSNLDYVLTAKISSLNPFSTKWYDLAFGGRGEAPGQLGTGHGITVLPNTKRLDISDRLNAKVERYSRYGHHLGTLRLPKGSFPCDIDYEGGYAVIGCLFGPDRSQGAPIYVLENDQLISTIMPKEELGLGKFQHIHDAVIRRVNGRFYIIAQSWNPGDFVILEQVAD